MNPLKQGLKQNILYLLQGFLTVKEVNPLKQGLKLFVLLVTAVVVFDFVKEVNPLKQGLKPPFF